MVNKTLDWISSCHIDRFLKQLKFCVKQSGQLRTHRANEGNSTDFFFEQSEPPKCAWSTPSVCRKHHTMAGVRKARYSPELQCFKIPTNE